VRGQFERPAVKRLSRCNHPGSEAETYCFNFDVAASLRYLSAGWTNRELQKRGCVEIDAIGHRIVHGGELFAESTVITDEVLKGIEGMRRFSPAPHPNNIKGIMASRQVFVATCPGRGF